MRVLVIGGTGFIGRAVVSALAGNGCQIAVFHRGSTSTPLPTGCIEILGDRRNLEEFRKPFERFSPEVVVDLCLYDGEEAAATMQTFLGTAQRVVAISSMDVYHAYGRFCRLEDGDLETEPFTENSPLRTRLFPYRSLSKQSGDLLYRYDKIPVEQRVLGTADISGTVLRLAKVYGPGDSQHHVAEYLDRMNAKSEITLSSQKARWRWTRVFVDNAAAAIVAATLSPISPGRVYNVGESTALEEREWVTSIADAAAWPGEITVAEPTEPERYDWSQNLVADTTLIRRELGYVERVGLRDGLEIAVAWERSRRL